VPLPRREHWTRQGCSTKSLTLGLELENSQDPERSEPIAVQHSWWGLSLWPQSSSAQSFVNSFLLSPKRRSL
jgi:hypothetical protein